MAARLEIEIVDRSPPPQQGGQGGVPQPAPTGSGWEPPRPAYERPGAGMDTSGLQPSQQDYAARHAEEQRQARRQPWATDADMGDRAAASRDNALGAGMLGFRNLAAFLAAQAQAREQAAVLDPRQQATGWQAAAPYLGMARAASGAVGDAAQGVGNLAATASGVGANIAQNNIGGAAFQAADGLTQLAGKIPIVGAAFEGILGAATSVTRGFTDMVAAFVDRGKQISGYNAPLAQATAEAEVRDILFDIREANELGTEYARLTSASSEAWTAIKEAMLPIKKFLLEVLASFLETVLPYLQRLPTAVKETGSTLADLLKLQQDVFSGSPLAGLREFLKKFGASMDRLVDNTEKRGDGTDTIENMLKVLRSGGGEAGFFPLNGQGGGGGLNIPIVGGA
jgi:hypothetical protein